MSDISLQEEEEHDEGHESESDDEETVLYNPKNLPLGWDGKVTVTIESLCTLKFAAASSSSLLFVPSNLGVFIQQKVKLPHIELDRTSHTVQHQNQTYWWLRN